MLVGFVALRRMRLIEDVPTSTVAGVFMGTNEVTGTVDAPQSLVGPLSDSSCVWFRHEIAEEWRRTQSRMVNGKPQMQVETGWKTLEESHQTLPEFWIVDDTGRLKIKPEGARVTATSTVDETCTYGEPLYERGPVGSIPNSTNRRRFTEEALVVGSPIFVLGPARLPDEGPAVPEMADGDGPFLISVRSEHQITSLYRWGARAALVAAVVLAFLAPIAAADPVVDESRLSAAGAQSVLLAVLAGALIGGFWLVLVWNGLVSLRNRAQRAWSLIDVQLRRRHDLIPQLVAVVDTYAAHERSTHQALAGIRSELPWTTADEATRAAHEQTRAIEQTYALAEAYPELQATEQFSKLQTEIVNAEDRIASAREFYNDSVTAMRHRSTTFPGVVVARLGRFDSGELFAAEGLERSVPVTTA